MRALAIAVVAAGCTHGAPDARPRLHSPQQPAPPASAEPRATPETDKPAPLAPPTRATAGAKACSLGEVVTLGAHDHGKIVLGFDGSRGIAAWITAAHTLALRPLAPDGAPIGTAASVTIPDDVEPDSAYAVGARFVILLRLWDWRANHVAWWAIVTDRDAHAPTAPTALPLDDLDILAAAPLDDSHVALHVGPAYIAKNRTLPPRWVSLAVDGSPAINPTIAVPATTPSPDTITPNIFNGAEPPPPGPGGRIYEAAGRPVLERLLAQQRLGDTLDLEWHGSPINHGMMISTDLAWTGTHFLYPFTDGEARLLPIDCRP